MSVGLEAQVRQRAGFRGRRRRALLPADGDRGTAQTVPGRVDGLVREEQHRARALDILLGDAEAVEQALALVDQCGDQLRMFPITRR